MRRKVRNIQKSTQSCLPCFVCCDSVESFYAGWEQTKSLCTQLHKCPPSTHAPSPPATILPFCSTFCFLGELCFGHSPFCFSASTPDPMLFDLTPPTLSLKILDLQETRHLGQTSQKIVAISLETFPSVFCDTTLLAFHRLD